MSASTENWQVATRRDLGLVAFATLDSLMLDLFKGSYLGSEGASTSQPKCSEYLRVKRAVIMHGALEAEILYASFPPHHSPRWRRRLARLEPAGLAPRGS